MSAPWGGIISPRNRPFDLDGFSEDDQVSVSAFSKGIDKRNGTICVINGCGYDLRQCLNHCHIIPRQDEDTWKILQDDQFIPRTTERGVSTYPRNGLLLCKSHHALFDAFHFFIRYREEDQRYYFVNVKDEPCLRQFHGKACLLDSASPYAPHPNLLLHDEQVTRAMRHEPTASYVIHSDSPKFPSDLSSTAVSRSPTDIHNERSQPSTPLNTSQTISSQFTHLRSQPVPPPVESLGYAAASMWGHWETPHIKELVLSVLSSKTQSSLRSLGDTEDASDGEYKSHMSACVSDNVCSWLTSVTDEVSPATNSTSLHPSDDEFWRDTNDQWFFSGRGGDGLTGADGST